MKYFKPIIIATIFITGACVLVIEVVATRILSPYFGNTIFTYSSIITVILAALSLGYYTGGKLADKYPSPIWFYGIILVSGLSTLLLQFLAQVLLPLIGLTLSLIYGPLIASLILFLLPAWLLGTLSPYAIKLLQEIAPSQGIGGISGQAFFWSTAGSIFGSLSAGFWLIPQFSTSTIILAVGSALITLGIFGLSLFHIDKKVILKIIMLAILMIAVSARLTIIKASAGILYDHEGVYSKIVIYDGIYQDLPARFLIQDLSMSAAVYPDSDGHVFDYTKFYALYKVFVPKPKNILVIGGGAYTIPKSYLADLPEVNVDVAEIEPELYNLSKKFFRLKDEPRLKNYIADGRRFLADSNLKYDVIFVDAYYSIGSVPTHLTTQEFFSLIKNQLAENGIMIANFIGDLEPRPHSLIYSEMKTLNSVFESTYFFKAREESGLELQNVMFVAQNSGQKVDIKKFDSADVFINSLKNKLISSDEVDFSQYPIFTDDYAPVEYYTAQGLRNAYQK